MQADNTTLSPSAIFAANRARGAVTFDVLAVFVDAMWAMRHGRMGVCRFRLAHRIVLGLTIGIVFLAKTMFYL